MLVLSRKKDEDIIIGEGEKQVVIRVVAINGDKVRLGFIAPNNVSIMRAEITAKKPEKQNGLERSPSRRPFYPF